jgi:hypothetical protein
MKNVFTRTDNTEEDANKMGVVRSVFGSILYTHNSEQQPLITTNKKSDDRQKDFEEVPVRRNDVKKDYKVINVGNCVKNYPKKAKDHQNLL